MTIRVLVWGENRHEQVEPHVAEIYPDGMHATIAAGHQREPRRQRDVSHHHAGRARARPHRGGAGRDRRARLVGARRARRGRRTRSSSGCTSTCWRAWACVVLHSGHWSKIFGKLMGTSCTLRWRSEQDRELVWTVNPTHPIAQGVPHPIIIEQQEMYGEFFDIPVPDELVFVSSFSGGRGVPQSGCTFRRGHGKIFYFSPGRPGLPGLPPQGRPQGDRERRRLGQQRPARA